MKLTLEFTNGGYDFSNGLPDWGKVKTWNKLKKHEKFRVFKNIYIENGIPPMKNGRVVQNMNLYNIVATMNKTITWEEIFAIEDVDHRAWVIENIGWESFLKNHKNKIIDKNDNPIIGTLYSTDIIDGDESIHILMCLDPASNSNVFLRVNPSCTTAKDARTDLDPLSEFGDDYLMES